MPDGPSGLKAAAGVVLLTCKDDLRNTVRPCLDASGAEVARTVHLAAVAEAAL